MDQQLDGLFSLHRGAIRRKEWLEAKIPASLIRSALKSGEIVQHNRGVLAYPHTSKEWAAYRAQGADVGCVTAAETLGLWVLNKRQPPHLTAPSQLTRQGQLGREGQLSGQALRIDESGIEFVVHRRGASGIFALLKQCSVCLPELEALAIAESAVILKKVSLQELHQLGRRTALGKIARLINPASESILETVARYHLEKAGYHVQVQKYLSGLGRLDLLVNGILGVEPDGKTYHSNAKAFAEDRRRNNFYTLHGIPTLRFTYAMVVHQPESFLEMVKSALHAHSPVNL